MTPGGSLVSPIAATLVLASASAAATTGVTPFAAQVTSYDPGSNPVPGYTNPEAALGEPTRFTGGAFDPMVVSVLNPAWRPEEIVSIGEGGQLTLEFAAPITDDPLNPWGIDLMVFGNSFFSANQDDPTRIGSPASLFAEGGVVEVSADGIEWVAVDGVDADGPWPTHGWLDVDDPYADEPGTMPTNPLRPVNPTWSLPDFDGASIEDVQLLYAGSAGGVGIDLASTGLSAVTWIRISNPVGSGVTPEIDAVSDVAARLPGDVDGDGRVDVNDLLALLQFWGPSHPAGWDADFNSDGAVDVEDLLALLAAWG